MMNEVILYAAKTGDNYLHKEKDGSATLVGLERTSVYPKIEDAKALAALVNDGRVVELLLTEKECLD